MLGGLLPGRTDAGSFERALEAALGLPDDAGLIAARIRRSRLGPEGRDVLKLHENAFRDLGGVPLVVRHDNLKTAAARACLYDPDINAIYAAFAAHWGFTPLPSRPRNPQENG